jgi:hypothetical protein
MPVYDWLRGERINADVPPSRVDQHGHSGRHCLDEHMPGAVPVVVWPWWCGRGGVAVVVWPWWCGRQVAQRMA